VATGADNWKAKLKKQFPSEHKGIDKYFKLLEELDEKPIPLFMLGALKVRVARKETINTI
jgi:hypothetical protein